MSPYSLRCDAHRIVLRGVSLIRTIEILRALDDEAAIVARQQELNADADLECDASDASDDDEWAPTPKEIAEARDAIKAAWSDVEREGRWRFERVTPTRLKRFYAEGGYRVKSKDFSSRSEINRRYRERHREKLLAKERAKRQDPNRRAAKRASDLRWYEKSQLAIKERTHERREEINVRCREWRAANRDVVNDRRREARRAQKLQLAAC